ncbi:hypothetical protein CMI41_03955 [Candidatus Pacearchaeota archaeon]|nr:hypothetical protein [Candidatus Pacearchaeota archaeon]|tara:strand:+ start:3599 stop:4324 length:726 start_codon:yes stop_codon:yes gene_type:complete
MKKLVLKGWTKRKKGVVLLIILSGVLYWFYSGAFYGDSGLREYVVDNITDGDTVLLDSGAKVRLMGLNTPETGMLNGFEVEMFLEELVLGKKVSLDNFGEDRYGRTLGYLFLDGENVNELILKNGFASLYYYQKDEYYSDMKEAEESAMEEKVGIWKESSRFGCLEIGEFVWLDDSEDDFEKLVLINSCDPFEITFKDDATHIYLREIGDELTLETQNIWNDNGDSLYAWDDEGLVLFYRY